LGRGAGFDDTAYTAQKDRAYADWKKKVDKEHKLAKAKLLSGLDAEETEKPVSKDVEKEHAEQLRKIKMETTQLRSKKAQLDAQSPVGKGGQQPSNSQVRRVVSRCR
jgi:hypothetical protein